MRHRSSTIPWVQTTQPFLAVCSRRERAASVTIYLSICSVMYIMIVVVVAVYLSICLSVYLSVCLSIYLTISLNLTTSKMKQFCQTSSIFELDNIRKETSLRDFLNFRSWQHQKRNNSARLPSKMESWVQSWRPRTNEFCDFSTPPV